MKDRILDIAREKFIKEGYSNVNMDDLARDLGMSKRTVYEQYESKKNLFLEVAKATYEEANRDSDELLTRMAIEDNKYHFFDEIKNLWELIIKHSKLFNANFQADIRKYAPEGMTYCYGQKLKNDENFQKIFEIGIKTGNIKPTMNKDIFYLVYFSSMKNLLHPEIMADLSVSTKDAIEQIYDVIMLGVLSDKGKKEYNKTLHKEDN